MCDLAKNVPPKGVSKAFIFSTDLAKDSVDKPPPDFPGPHESSFLFCLAFEKGRKFYGLPEVNTFNFSFFMRYSKNG